MRTESENYIRLDFGVIDLGVHTAVGDRTLWVYTVLRRYVWRSTSSGPDALRRAYAKGKLIAKVSQGVIAKHLGIGRDTVNRAISTLEEMAWIEKTQGEHDGSDELVYILGEVVEQGGGYHEVFTADALCWKLMQKMRDLAEKRGLESIHKIDLDDRIALTKRYFGRNKGKPINKEVSESQTGGVLESDRGCLTSRHWESDFSTHNREDIENENREPRIHNSSSCETPSGVEGISVGNPVFPPSPGYHVSGKRETSAVTHRVIDGSDRLPPADHVVLPKIDPPLYDSSSPRAVDPSSREDRIRRAQERASAAKRKHQEERTAKDRKRSERDLKLRNLGGAGARKDPAVKRQVSRLENVWRLHFKRAFPDVPLAAWEGREVGQVLQLVEKYNVGIVEDGLRYVTSNWKKIAERFKKAPQTPTVGWLLAVHDSLIPEASKFGKVVGILEKWETWWKKHPDEDPPPALEREFEKHRAEMEALDLL